jgi:hypothetical protein
MLAAFTNVVVVVVLILEGLRCIGQIDYFVPSPFNGNNEASCPAVCRWNRFWNPQGDSAALSIASTSMPHYCAAPLRVLHEQVVGKEGFLAFWKGNLTSVIHRFPYSAINFHCYESCVRYV